jgi:hypothetical protein
MVNRMKRPFSAIEIWQGNGRFEFLTAKLVLSEVELLLMPCFFSRATDKHRLHGFFVFNLCLSAFICGLNVLLNKGDLWLELGMNHLVRRQRGINLFGPAINPAV